MNNFDVIIVGAGPAGSFAAERLARAGVSVALFDGRPPGEPKACGGGVTSKALKAWPHLLEAVGRTIDELDMYSPSGKHLHLKLEEPFAVYSRIAFDTFLRERARTAGAVVIAEKVSARAFQRKRDAAGWIERTQGGADFFCNYLVGADGANSAIAKKLAGPLPPAEMEVAFGYRAPLPDSLMRSSLSRSERARARAHGEQQEREGAASPLDPHPNPLPAREGVRNSPKPPATVVAFLPNWVGYAWAFPRIDHVSFGIATTQDAFDHEKLDALLWDFMLSYYRSVRSGSVSDRIKIDLWKKMKADARTDSLRGELERSAERYAARIPGLAPRTWDTRRACGDGWALLGDAAGFADPVTGEGIYYALRSAELFAEAYLKGNAERYEARWREDFGGELKRASEMRRRFYGNFWGAPFTDRMIEFARGHRGIRKVLGQLVAGDQGYVNLKKKLARSALKPL
ncbi:MAG TPA: NAD(P)/FAD-dependent oxidoreductase [Chthoniobacterales bacterium]